MATMYYAAHLRLGRTPVTIRLGAQRDEACAAFRAIAPETLAAAIAGQRCDLEASVYARTETLGSLGGRWTLLVAE